ncbi:Uncharacterized protein Rs2_34797 [Raphanus sativus]|nr:Uncharacterized protein Rs2_34797 [Raphanus sativus]
MITGLNCEYIEDLDTPKCDVTPEMVSFWGKMGVYLEAGPTTDQIIDALKRCGDWSTEDRKRLAYLSIFTGFIEGRKFSTATRATLARLVMDLERFENYPWGRVSFKVLMDSLWNKEITGCYTVDGFIQVLQVWAYTALPGMGASIGSPRLNSSLPLPPPILAYDGSRGRRFMKAAILSQTRVINFVEKDISEMWPKWDSEVEDVPAENIIKVMYDRRPWKWTMDCWEVTGTKTKFVTPSKRAKEMVVVEVEEEEEDNQRPRKKARKEAPKEARKEAPKEAREEAREEASEEAREEAREEASWVTREELENMFKDLRSGLGDMMKDGFKKCIREIKKLSDRLEAVEKKVGVTNQATPQAKETGVSNKQPTPQAKETGVSNKQPTPQAKETGVRNKQPTPQAKETGVSNKQPTPQTQPTPQKDQPTLQTNHPTPQTRQRTPQKAKPTPQKAKPTPQKKQPSPQTKQPSPLPKKRLLPEDTADEAISVYKILPEDKADGVTSKEIVPLTSTDQPSFASNDQQPSFASTDPSVPVSEPSLVVLDKTAPTASVRARSERTKKPAPTQISPYTAETKKLLRVGKYNPFPSLNRPKLKELADWLKTDP